MTAPQAALPRSTLPVSLTRFIGREKELALAAERLGEARLVTLVGPGGMGKTRLAIEAARAWLDSHPIDAWFVDLSAATDEVGLERAVAAAVEVTDDGKTELGEHVLAYLRDGSALVVFDNCSAHVPISALSPRAGSRSPSPESRCSKCRRWTSIPRPSPFSRTAPGPTRQHLRWTPRRIWPVRSASNWTACRSPSSSPPRARGRFRCRKSTLASETGSRCFRRGAVRSPNAIGH